MASPIIKVDNLSKQYRLGQVGTSTIKDDFTRWWYRVRGKEDPFLTIGETNDRSIRSSSEYVWSLKNINFKVQQGEVFGIIGRNGAGKSTLLKILSRVTEPTTGKIIMKGRVASLLEVGTGFHPDLTGRENIYLNGAILGMTRKEISGKLDEIIDFAGVERYIDTPVKRYSSGMYVRLGFAVAAHLEPDILIVDEVLAVGDLDFQKKCLGKMKEISSSRGRTVLFVSHNMTAIRNLCDNTIILDKGLLLELGPTETVVQRYIQNSYSSCNEVLYEDCNGAPGNEKVKLKRMAITPISKNVGEPIFPQTPILVEFEFWNFETTIPINLSMHVYNLHEECIFNVVTDSLILSKGVCKGVCLIPGSFLNDNIYTISMMIVGERSYPIYNFENLISIEVVENREESGWHGKWPGYVRPTMDFKLESF